MVLSRTSYRAGKHFSLKNLVHQIPVSVLLPAEIYPMLLGSDLTALYYSRSVSFLAVPKGCTISIKLNKHYTQQHLQQQNTSAKLAASAYTERALLATDFALTATAHYYITRAYTATALTTELTAQDHDSVKNSHNSILRNSTHNNNTTECILTVSIATSTAPSPKGMPTTDRVVNPDPVRFGTFPWIRQNERAHH